MADGLSDGAPVADLDLAGESGDLFRAVAVNSSVGMCLVGTDGRFRWVNPAICQLFGRAEEQLGLVLARL